MSRGEGKVESIPDAIRLDYEGLLVALRTGDPSAVNPFWHRLQLMAHVGGFSDVEEQAARFWDASGTGDHSQIDEALRGLHTAVVGLPKLSLPEASARGAVSAAQLAYVEFILAQQARDPKQVTEWWRRLSDAAQLGGLSELELSLKAYVAAMATRDQPSIERATENLYQAVLALA